MQSNVPKINFKSIYNRKVRVDRLVAFNRAARLECASKQSKKSLKNSHFLAV